MQTSLLTLICCPACGGSLRVAQHKILESAVRNGELNCTQCPGIYSVFEGLPHLYIQDERWLSIERQVAILQSF
jgi:uncharacterized protein YbaR (Trm112 family)